MKINIGKKVINKNSPPFIIAEAGSNFDQSLKKAIDLIKIAKKAECDAVKFQLFDASKLYPDNKVMRKIFQNVQIKRSFLIKIKKKCDELNIEFMCSPFDLESAKFLSKIGINSFKIASSEISNYKLLNYAARSKKLCLVSLGMAIEEDVIKIKKIFKKYKNQNLVLMQCTSEYPAKLENLNLRYLTHISQKHKLLSGFSDHSLGHYASIVALGQGANFFEKHFTYNKKAKGPDHSYALNQKELTKYVKVLKKNSVCLGNKKKIELIDGVKNSSRRCGLYLKRDIKAGELIKKNHLIFKAPPKGFLDIEIDKVLNKKIQVNKKKHQFLSKNDFI
jgi:sialic acid synthase SpsE